MRFTLVLSLVFVFNTAFTQWDFGVRAGFGGSTTSPEEVFVQLKTDEIAYKLGYLGNNATYSVGLFAERKFEAAFLEVGVNYAKSSSIFEITGFGDYRSASNVYYEHYQNIEVPVLAGAKVKFLRFGVGPVFNYNLSTDSQIPTVEGFNANENKINFGSQAAFGASVGILTVDLRYTRRFAEIADHFSYGGNIQNGFKQTPTELKVTIGISF